MLLQGLYGLLAGRQATATNDAQPMHNLWPINSLVTWTLKEDRKRKSGPYATRWSSVLWPLVLWSSNLALWSWNCKMWSLTTVHSSWYMVHSLSSSWFMLCPPKWRHVWGTITHVRAHIMYIHTYVARGNTKRSIAIFCIIDFDFARNIAAVYHTFLPSFSLF